jgi:hypothetical protein
MILGHWGIKMTQEEVARAFARTGPGPDINENLEMIDDVGTRPTEQHTGLSALVAPRGLLATIWFPDAPEVQRDWNRAVPRILEELNRDRPIQRQLKSTLHVDVIAGWRRMVGTEDLMLHIYDPARVSRDPYWDRWGEMATNVNDLIFVHPPGA